MFSWILTIVTHGDLDGIVWFQSLFSWILTSEIPDVFNTADHSFQSLFSWILTYIGIPPTCIITSVSILVFLDFNLPLGGKNAEMSVLISILVFLDFNRALSNRRR